MGKEEAVNFIGHKECYCVRAENVRYEIENLIGFGVTDFLNGSIGGSDWMCARVIYDLKRLSSNTELPYHPLSHIQNQRSKILRCYNLSRRF